MEDSSVFTCVESSCRRDWKGSSWWVDRLEVGLEAGLEVVIEDGLVVELSDGVVVVLGRSGGSESSLVAVGLSEEGS